MEKDFQSESAITIYRFCSGKEPEILFFLLFSGFPPGSNGIRGSNAFIVGPRSLEGWDRMWAIHGWDLCRIEEKKARLASISTNEALSWGYHYEFTRI